MAIHGSPRRQRLRRATQQAHARLDALIDDAGFLRGRQQYALYLEATWAARRPAEAALGASAAVVAYKALPQRAVCDALRQDIIDVGLRIFPQQDDGSTVESFSEGQVLGTLYVLEGSALGARLLEKRVAAIGMSSVFGARHMACQTSEPQAWSSFIQLLDQTELDPPEDALCIRAALDTFNAFEVAFQAVAQ